jgi:hypothetical protein
MEKLVTKLKGLFAPVRSGVAPQREQQLRSGKETLEALPIIRPTKAQPHRLTTGRTKVGCLEDRWKSGFELPLLA